VICGVDEAGKGSVLGPMVIAGVSVRSAEAFSDLGVNDSKMLTPARREQIYPLLRKRCRVATVVISAHEIDTIRREMTMNACIARAHAAVIQNLSPTVAYIDACDVNPLRYADEMKRHLGLSCELVSEHHADQTYPVVSAASIIAKVMRDRAIRELAKTYGNIGSGYPSDPVTVTYLTTYIKTHGVPPPIARASWKTVSAILGKKAQSRLSEFF